MRIHRHVLASRIDGVALRPGRRQGNALWHGRRVRLGGAPRCRCARTSAIQLSNKPITRLPECRGVSRYASTPVMALGHFNRTGLYALY